jgi:hypothetical protein
LLSSCYQNRQLKLLIFIGERHHLLSVITSDVSVIFKLIKGKANFLMLACFIHTNQYCLRYSINTVVFIEFYPFNILCVTPVIMNFKYFRENDLLPDVLIIKKCSHIKTYNFKYNFVPKQARRKTFLLLQMKVNICKNSPYCVSHAIEIW